MDDRRLVPEPESIFSPLLSPRHPDVVAAHPYNAYNKNLPALTRSYHLDLVVTADETDEPVGIITKTDVIEALTWERDDRNAVQVFGLDLLEGMNYDDVSALIEGMASKYGELSVIKANIELQEHKEQSRGVPLVLARIRLVTDRGYVTADGEGYGASHALRLAANAVERQLLKGKIYGQSKKHRDTDEQEQLYGWWLGG